MKFSRFLLISFFTTLGTIYPAIMMVMFSGDIGYVVAMTVTISMSFVSLISLLVDARIRYKKINEKQEKN